MKRRNTQRENLGSRRHDYFASLVPSFCNLLACGAVCAPGLSLCLVAALALSAGWNCGPWSPGAAMGDSDAAGKAAEGAVPGVSLLCKEELAQAPLYFHLLSNVW